ncbi:MAG: hypothetical protein EOO38_13550 [Cytophagaceae bacterium]|nr:MAG: hypothetical protein EOO38_13550 [Cytophagaceae bacterium]
MAKQTMPAIQALTLIDQLMEAAFNKPRDPRSDAYRLGVTEILKCRTMSVKYQCPYELGTAEADAFFSGNDEDNAIWRAHLDSDANHGATVNSGRTA